MIQVYWVVCWRANWVKDWEIANHASPDKSNYTGEHGVYTAPLTDRQRQYWFGSDADGWKAVSVPVYYNEETGECS